MCFVNSIFKVHIFLLRENKEAKSQSKITNWKIKWKELNENI